MLIYIWKYICAPINAHIIYRKSIHTSSDVWIYVSVFMQINAYMYIYTPINSYGHIGQKHKNVYDDYKDLLIINLRAFSAQM